MTLVKDEWLTLLSLGTLLTLGKYSRARVTIEMWSIFVESNNKVYKIITKVILVNQQHYIDHDLKSRSQADRCTAYKSHATRCSNGGHNTRNPKCRTPTKRSAGWGWKVILRFISYPLWWSYFNLWDPVKYNYTSYEHFKLIWTFLEQSINFLCSFLLLKNLSKCHFVPFVICNSLFNTKISQ